MIREAAAQVRNAAPLRIDDVGYNDPMLGLSGVEWSLHLGCPWRLLRAGQLVCSPMDLDDVPELLRPLIGLDVVALSSLSTSETADPVWHLSDGSQLQAFSDTDLDPWVMRLPGMTFVGGVSGQ